jgi:hypothetical protein
MTSSIPKVTGDQVRDAMVAANILRVDLSTCTFCHCITFYTRQGDQLFFSPHCNCTAEVTPLEPRSWQSVADNINMQNDEWKVKVAARFGLSLNPDKHERRVVGHISGWKEQMATCVCGQTWPCPSLNGSHVCATGRVEPWPIESCSGCFPLNRGEKHG